VRLRRQMLAALLILSFMSLLRGQTSGTAAPDSLNLGLQALGTGNAQQAIEYFERAKQMDPTLTVADLNLATAHASLYIPCDKTAANEDHVRKAIAGFESYLSGQPDNTEALNGLARMYQATAKLGKARDVHKRLAILAPQDPVEAWAVASLDWIMTRDKANPLSNAEKASSIEEGLNYTDTALQLDPQYVDAMTYKNLLVREKAALSTDPAEVARLMAEAYEWFDKALKARASQANTPNRVEGGREPQSVLPVVCPPPPPNRSR